jgi:hypothetical protein
MKTKNILAAKAHALVAAALVCALRFQIQLLFPK